MVVVILVGIIVFTIMVWDRDVRIGVSYTDGDWTIYIKRGSEEDKDEDKDKGTPTAHSSQKEVPAYSKSDYAVILGKVTPLAKAGGCLRSKQSGVDVC